MIPGYTRGLYRGVRLRALRNAYREAGVRRRDHIGHPDSSVEGAGLEPNSRKSSATLAARTCSNFQYLLAKKRIGVPASAATERLISAPLAGGDEATAWDSVERVIFQATSTTLRSSTCECDSPLSCSPRRFLVRRGHERDRRPRGRRHRDPLVVAMRETAFEIGLKTKRSRADAPRAIGLLGSHQVINAASVRRAVN